MSELSATHIDVRTDAHDADAMHAPLPVTQPTSSRSLVQALVHAVVMRVSAINRRYRNVAAYAPRLRRLGITGATGGGLLMVAAVLCAAILMPLRQQVAALHAQWAEANAAVICAPGATRSTPATRAETFVAQLPVRAQLPGILTTIAGQADAAGIRLDRGEYAMTLAKSGELAHYDLTFPLQGTYPAVRKFIDGTLAAVPAAALESVRLERTEVADATLTAELKFVVFVRGSP